MITTDVGAYNEMCARVREIAGSTDALAIVGYAPEVRYDLINYPKQPTNTLYWMRFTLIGAGVRRRTLGKPALITQQGTADIQLFAPISDKNSAGTSMKLAQLLKSAYATSTASVDFYDAAIRVMPREESWFYLRINATYNFDIQV